MKIKHGVAQVFADAATLHTDFTKMDKVINFLFISTHNCTLIGKELHVARDMDQSMS